MNHLVDSFWWVHKMLVMSCKVSFPFSLPCPQFMKRKLSSDWIEFKLNFFLFFRYWNDLRGWWKKNLVGENQLMKCLIWCRPQFEENMWIRNGCKYLHWKSGLGLLFKHFEFRGNVFFFFQCSQIFILYHRVTVRDAMK